MKKRFKKLFWLFLIGMLAAFMGLNNLATFASANSEEDRVVKVDNLDPNVSFNIIETIPVHLHFEIGESNHDDILAFETVINEEVVPILIDNNIELDTSILRDYERETTKYYYDKYEVDSNTTYTTTTTYSWGSWGSWGSERSSPVGWTYSYYSNTSLNSNTGIASYSGRTSTTAGSAPTRSTNTSSTSSRQRQTRFYGTTWDYDLNGYKRYYRHRTRNVESDTDTSSSTSYSRGSYIETVVAEDGTYPNNGRQSGYWWVKRDNYLESVNEGDSHELGKGEVKFFVSVLDNELTSDEEDEIKNKAINHDAILMGLGTSENMNQYESMIAEVSPDGGVYDNSTLRASSQEIANQMIEVVQRHRTEEEDKEIYITLNEFIDYATYYYDSEDDPKYDDRWRFEHDDSVFENSMGVSSFHDQELNSPLNTFQQVGKFTPYYKAQDNPVESKDHFQEYRKWSSEVSGTPIYVHREPVADFSFSIDFATGDVTYEEKSYDLDAYSTDIGNGPGIESIDWHYRLEGDIFWTTGKPDNVYQEIYEVQKKVTDFQGASNTIERTVDGTDTNVPPVSDFDFSPKEDLYGSTEMDFYSLAYHPKGQEIVNYSWEISFNGGSWVPMSSSENFSGTYAPNNYSARLIVEDEHGFIGISPIKEFVIHPYEAPTADFVYNPTEDLLPNTTINFFNKSEDALSQPLEYSWEKRLIEDDNGDKEVLSENPEVLNAGSFVYDDGDGRIIKKGDGSLFLEVQVYVQPFFQGYEFLAIMDSSDTSIGSNMRALLDDGTSIPLYSQEINNTNRLSTLLFEINEEHLGKSITSLMDGQQEVLYFDPSTFEFEFEVVSFHINNSTVILSEWFPEGTEFSTQEHPNNRLDEGLWEIRLTVTNNISTLQDSKVERIAVGPYEAPNADFDYSPSADITTDTMVEFSNKSTDPYGDPLEYMWEKRLPGETSWEEFSTRTHPVQQLDEVGSWEVRLTATNEEKNTSSSTMKIIPVQQIEPVYDPPIADFEYHPTSNITPVTEISFTNLSSDPYGEELEFTWKKRLPGESTWETFSSEEHPKETISQTGYATVKLEVYNPNTGLSDSARRTILVVDLPPIAEFTFNNLPFYVGGMIDIQNAATDPGEGNLDITFDLYYLDSSDTETFIEQKEFTDVADPYDFSFRFDHQITDDAFEGSYRVFQTVDNGSQQDTYELTTTIEDLDIQGFVNHTDQWESFHLTEGNDLNQFYSGEVFMLEALTTDYPIHSVEVQFEGQQIDGNTLSLTEVLNEVTNSQWEGSLHHDSMLDRETRLRDGSDTVTFEFIVAFDNEGNTIRTDTVQIEIIGSVHDAYIFRRSY